MWIVVDSNEARTGLATLLAATWDSVKTRRLSAGDIAIGPRVLVERKTTHDFAASMTDGRLFDQASRLARLAPTPVIIQEGDPATLEWYISEGQYRGALLSLSVGFRIPVLFTRDLEHTATVLRHMAAQECKRIAREQRRTQRATSQPPASPIPRLPPEALDVLRAMPGIGRARAAALAEHIGSLQNLACMSARNLRSIPGIGPDTADRIVSTLRASPPP